MLKRKLTKGGRVMMSIRRPKEPPLSKFYSIKGVMRTIDTLKTLIATLPTQLNSWSM